MVEMKTLVTQAQAGHLDAYNVIVRRFQDMAVGYAYAILGDFHLAEDVAQEAFITAYLDLAQLREPAAFPGWFRRVVFTQCNRLTRGKQLAMVDIKANTHIPAVEKDPVEQMVEQENRDQIEAAIQMLPEQECLVITLFYMNDFSQADIADFLEMPVTTVNNRLHSARKHLKEVLMKMAKDTLHSKRPSRDALFMTQISQWISAIEAVTSGNVPVLKAMIKENAILVKARTDNQTMEKKQARGYFAGATLLHYVAGNPIRGRLPDNIVEVTETLLAAGAEVDACTQFDDWSWTPLGLVASGEQAFRQGFSEKLIDTLLQASADINFNNGMNLYGALLNTQECEGQKDVAGMLFERGAKVDLCFAAGLSKLDLVADFFEENGTLKPNAYALYRPERDRLQDPTDQAVMAEACVWACFNNCPEVVDYFLNKDVNIDAKPSVFGIRATGLHRAASAGWEDMVIFLIEKGADVMAKDDTYQLSPLEWAAHAKREGVVKILRQYQS